MTSVDSYIKDKRLQDFSSIETLPKIYFDTNYWIKMRDAEGKGGVDEDILVKVRNLVENNKCIAPISEVLFWEILKQSDKISLTKSAQLIDELSKGYCIISEDQRISLEFYHFMRTSQKREVHEKGDLVWTNIAMNILYPILLQPSDILQKLSFIDFLGKISFESILSLIQQQAQATAANLKDNIEFLTWARERYKNQNNTFEQLFISELAGLVDLKKHILAEVMENMYCRDTGKQVTEEERNSIDSNELRNFICNGFRLNKLNLEFPSFSIPARLYADARRNIERKYDGHDTFDFKHATAALPYYDYFFTEKNLAHVIKANGLDVSYQCTVESKPDRVLQILNSL